MFYHSIIARGLNWVEMAIASTYHQVNRMLPLMMWRRLDGELFPFLKVFEDQFHIPIS
jgi:hypothetical protein